MKKLAIGCGIVLVLLIALVVSLIFAGPKIAQGVGDWFKTTIKEAADKAQFEATWKPPTPEPGEQWFPEEVAGWKRTTAAAFHELPELRSPRRDDDITPPGTEPPPGPGLTKDGYSATYMLGGQRIEVKVITVTDLEKEGMMARVRGFTPLPENRGSTSSVQLGSVLTMKFGESERIYSRPFRDWFILLHTTDGADLKPFAEAWLKAIDTQTAEAPIVEEKPK